MASHKSTRHRRPTRELPRVNLAEDYFRFVRPARTGGLSFVTQYIKIMVFTNVGRNVRHSMNETAKKLLKCGSLVAQTSAISNCGVRWIAKRRTQKTKESRESEINFFFFPFDDTEIERNEKN